MKKTIQLLLFALMLPNIGIAQTWFFGGNPTPPEKQYTHLIIYQKLIDRMVIIGDSASPTRVWETSTAIFESEPAAIEWLNTSDVWGDDRQKRVRLSEGELIGFYDLRTAQKITLALKTEKKRQERKVEIVTEADEWEDAFYIKQ